MLIIGTGAVATFLAETLAQTASEMQIFGSQSERLEALSKRFAPLGDTVAVSRPEQLQEHRLWVVCLKSWQNGKKAELLASAPRPEAILVLQNGLKPEEIWRRWPDVRVERGLSTYGSKIVSPGFAESSSRGTITLPQGSTFSSLFEEAGLHCRAHPNLAGAIWQKLAVNASLNVVCAIHNLANGDIFSEPGALKLVKEAAREVERVAQAEGVEWTGLSGVEQTLKVARNTARNICSTLADLRAGRPTEYDSINGELLRLARSKNLSTPVLNALDEAFRKRVSGLQKRNGLPVFSFQLPLLTPGQRRLEVAL